MPAAKTPTETTFSPNDTCTRSRDLPLSHLYQSKLKPFAKTGPGEKLPGRFFSIGGYEQGETAETGEVASGSWGNGKGRSRWAAPPGEWTSFLTKRTSSSSLLLTLIAAAPPAETAISAWIPPRSEWTGTMMVSAWMEAYIFVSARPQGQRCPAAGLRRQRRGHPVIFPHSPV